MTFAGPRIAPDLVERDPTTSDGPVGTAYGSEGWGFESLPGALKSQVTAS
jgi:hypothetical protein